MTVPAEPELERITPVELLDAVRDGRIRYPMWRPASAAAMVAALDSLRPGLPARRVLLWREPGGENTGWLLDGGDLVAAMGRLADGGGDDLEPAYLDADTGELLEWSRRPDFGHALVELDDRLLGDPDDLIREERLTGRRADQLRAVVRRLWSARVLLETLRTLRAELPRLMDHLPAGRRGVTLHDLDDRPISFENGPPASVFAWCGTPDRLIGATSGGTGSVRMPDDVRWRALLAAEGTADPGHSPGAPFFEDEGRPAVRAVRRALFVLHGWAGYPRHRSVPETGTVLVLARFFRLFPDVGLELGRLIRRWVWRTALSDVDPVGALDLLHGDATESVLRLLEARPAPALEPPGREPLDLDSSRGRLVLLGMADLHPRDLLSGRAVDVEGVRPRKILPDRPPEAANLLLAGVRHGRLLHDVLLDHATDPELLATHGVDRTALTALRNGDEDAFLARRAGILDDAVLRFWTTETEPAAITRAPLEMLFADETGQDDDDD